MEHSANQYRDESDTDMQLIELDRFVNAIDTNYKLTLNGPGQCSPIRLQESLFEAARVLMTKDSESLRKLKEWLEIHHRADLSRNIDLGLKNLKESGFSNDIAVPNYFVRQANVFSPLASWVDCAQ